MFLLKDTSRVFTSSATFSNGILGVAPIEA
jgi:hypothetical protein